MSFNAVIPSINIKTIQQAYAEPAEETEFLVDGLFPTGGLSALAGKPKAGKTTLVRQLAVAVATGSEFLGRATHQTCVLYLAIEEKQSEVTKHFRALGLPEDNTNLLLHCGAVDRPNALAELTQILAERTDVGLVIIDTLFKFVGVKDANDYAVVNSALGPLMELGRNTGVTILAVHHAKKAETDDLLDGALGSTAITGAVDTYMEIKQRESVRAVATRQRYGRDLEPTQLRWDAEARRVGLGQSCADYAEHVSKATVRRIGRDIRAYIMDNPDHTQDQILAAVTGKTAQKKEVFRELVSDGLLMRAGEGCKASPFTFCMANSDGSFHDGHI